jgi:branched-chain amino acid aminotransferase
MGLKVWINGKLVDKDQACVSVYDHGLLYGDGVFEGIRAYHGEVFKLDAHVRRLFDSAACILLKIPYSREQIKQALRDALAANAMTEAYFRLVVTRGAGSLGLTPPKEPAPVTFIIVDQIELYPPEMYETGMPAVVSSICRNHPNATPPQVKTCNYLNNILAKFEAVSAGAAEAIMLNAAGHVAECTGDNLFVIRDGRVRTPSLDQGALDGVTRGVVMEICRDMGLSVAEGVVTRADLYAADEVFLTGTAAEVIGISRIDSRPVGAGTTGPITRRIMAAFRELTRGR